MNNVLHCHILIYCIFALLTNSNIIGKLAIRDLSNWVIQELLLVFLAKTQYARYDKGPNFL